LRKLEALAAGIEGSHWFDLPGALVRIGGGNISIGLLFQRKKNCDFLPYQHRRRPPAGGGADREEATILGFFSGGASDLLVLFLPLAFRERSHRAGEVIGKTVGFAIGIRDHLPGGMRELIFSDFNFVRQHPKVAGFEAKPVVSSYIAGNEIVAARHHPSRHGFASLRGDRSAR